MKGITMNAISLGTIATVSKTTDAKTAIERCGAIKGGRLAAWRLLRCNPWAKGGYDPVPEKRSHRRVIREGKSLAHSDESEDSSDAE